jgi:hypothetical protein
MARSINTSAPFTPPGIGHLLERLERPRQLPLTHPDPLVLHFEAHVEPLELEVWVKPLRGTVGAWRVIFGQ